MMDFVLRTVAMATRILDSRAPSHQHTSVLIIGSADGGDARKSTEVANLVISQRNLDG